MKRKPKVVFHLKKIYQNQNNDQSQRVMANCPESLFVGLATALFICCGRTPATAASLAGVRLFQIVLIKAVES